LKELRTAEGVPLLENTEGGTTRLPRGTPGRGFNKASAGVCLAAGAGSSGYGRAPYYVQDAKIIALRTCDRGSPIPICTIVMCRPGMR
jgi:hypothetical protein